MLINQSRFKLNGNVGYVRKPDFLLSKSFDPANSKTFPRKKPLRFKVKVSYYRFILIGRPIRDRFQIISGQQIPKPNLSTKGEVVDPYVKVRVCGLDCDDHNIVTNNKYTTKTINNNGFRYIQIKTVRDHEYNPCFSPRWDEIHEFVVHLPELAFLEIIVYDKDKRSKDDKLGYCYLPMNYIREGYRNIPLFNKEGATLQPANLFFHFDISE